jgi:hypothetical protein
MVFPGTPLSSTNKFDRHNRAEILLKVALNTLTLKYLGCENMQDDHKHES